MDPYCQRLTDDLLVATGASRTTVRLIVEGGDLELVAESCAPGVASMATGPVVDPTVHPTYLYLERERKLLIQDDCRSGEPAPPASLVQHFGVWAQMLAPVVVNGEFTGTISVHQQGTTRQWDQAAVAALAAAERALEDHLGVAPARHPARTRD